MSETTRNEGVFTATARFMKYNMKLVFIIVFFTALISLAVFGNKGIIQRFKLEEERKELEKQLEAEHKKSEDLRKEIDLLKTSDKKIEEVAREKYGMTKDGEKILKVVVDSTK